MQKFEWTVFRLKRLVFLILIFTICLGILTVILFKKAKKRQTENHDFYFNSPPLLVSQNHKPTCPQNVNEDGYEIIDNKVITYPKCLMVMNSRLGSRFNMDWYFGNQIVRSGTMGNQQDFDSNLVLQIKDGDGEIEQIFPLQNNSKQAIVSNELGMTYQKIKYEFDDFDLILNIQSPFLPSDDLWSFESKVSASPFFYVDFEIINKSDKEINKKLMISLGDYLDKSDGFGSMKIYYDDPVDPHSRRILQASDKSNLEFLSGKNNEGYVWEVSLKKGKTSQKEFIYAAYTDSNIVTKIKDETQKKLKFAYTQWYMDVDEVVSFARINKNRIKRLVEEFEARLNDNSLIAEENWLAAQAFHSYIGNTFLMYNPTDFDYEYYVWEGEFKYFNTIDVAHDYAVLEGKYMPWVIRYELDSWIEVMKFDDYGAVIPHDIGINFTVSGKSGYKIPGWETSGMPVEENTNFIILAYWYYKQTGDSEYIQQLVPFINVLVESLIKRDTNNNGIADVGIGMTTYDTDSNAALKEGPDSTYLGLKQLSAYIMYSEMLALTGDVNGVDRVNDEAEKITSSFEEIYAEKEFVPLSLNKDFEEKIKFDGKTIKGTDEQGFTYISGLFYPALTDIGSEKLDRVLTLIKQSYDGAYQKSIVRKDSEIVGLQLTEYQDLHLGWFSHSTMADLVTEKYWGASYDSWQVFFPRIYDSPYGFTDGHYFRDPFYLPQLCLLYYPRGVTIFGFLKD